MCMRKLKLSILDQCPILEGSDVNESLRNTIVLGQLGDRLGYNRFWIAEHHGSRIFANPSPETMVALVANQTKRIRVGAGGVLLGYYSPFKVAETFNLLSGLFPDRIDLGVGRGLGTGNKEIIKALNEDGSVYDPNTLGEKVKQLMAFTDTNVLKNLWLLGASERTAEFAGRMGTSFSYAHFINDDNSTESIATYRDAHRRYHGTDGNATLALYVLACEDEDQSASASNAMITYLLKNSSPGVEFNFPKEVGHEKVMEYDPVELMKFKSRLVVGSFSTVERKLREIAHAHNVDELVVVSIAKDFKTKQRSFELLADSFNL